MQQEEEESSPNGRVHVSTATVFLRQSQTLPISLATPPQQAPPPTPPIDSIELQAVQPSEMSARIETSTSVKQWATPLEKHVTGQPPGPEDRPSTIEGEARRGNVRTITPSYKYGSDKPGAEINLGQSGSLPRAYGDYTVEQRQDMYKQTFIDPKVRSNANMPALSSTVPEPRRPRADDFPSQHTKRSFVKVDPLEQRKLKSVETIPITTSSYLTQSIERHRDMEASKLRDYLKAKEGDANKPWDKPGWPGPKPPANDESLRELESIKKSIETLQKTVIKRTQSMHELMLIPPEEFAKSCQPPVTPDPSTRDPGWLVKMRANRYLENAASSSLRKYRSMDILGGPSDRILDTEMNATPEGSDPLHWQLRKEFHLTKYSERRASWQHVSPPPPAQRTTPQLRTTPLILGPAPTEGHAHPSPSRYGSKSQLLYPPGSTENISSEHKPADRPREKTVYENKPLPPAVVALNISTEPLRKPDQESQKPVPQGPAPSGIEEYPARLMSPPPSHQPRGILKQQRGESRQYSYTEAFSERREQRAETSSQLTYTGRTTPQQSVQQPDDRDHPQASMMRPGSVFQELPEEEKMRIMQENLQKHRQNGRVSAGLTPKPPAMSFNGPFFKLEEVDDGTRPVRHGPHGGQEEHDPRHTPQQRSVHYEQHEQYYRSTDGQQQNLQRMKQMSASEAELSQHNQLSEEEKVVIWPPPPKERQRSQSVMARSITDPDRIDEFRRQKELEREAIWRREQRQQEAMQKQIVAMQIQQQRLYEQQHGVRSPVPLFDTIHPPNHYQPESPVPHGFPQYQEQQPQPVRDFVSPQQQLYPPPPPQQYQGISPTPELNYERHPTNDPGPPPPQQVRVFETRPIGADNGDRTRQTPNPSWKRTYIVEKPDDVAKNEILKSEEVLEKDLGSVPIDLLKRREAFVEVAEPEPEIFRTGRRWQPPPEKPYVWPTVRRPVSVDPHMMPTNFTPGPPRSADDGTYEWEPVVVDPGYKKERKNFTPDHTPPHSPIRGHGTGPLDEPAKRQSKYLITPSADGSHRPKPAFRGARQTPSGGFFPHAPNAVKVIKHRPPSSARDVTSPDGRETLEIIHQRNYRRVDDAMSPLPRPPSTVEPRSRLDSYQAQSQDIPDWEKIYDLPPHSSTLVGKDRPQNVDVKRRLAQFEESTRRITGRQSSRAQSLTHLDQIQPHYPHPDYDELLKTKQPQQHATNTLPSRPRTSERESREERAVREHRERRRREQQLRDTRDYSRREHSERVDNGDYQLMEQQQERRYRETRMQTEEQERRYRDARQRAESKIVRERHMHQNTPVQQISRRNSAASSRVQSPIHSQHLPTRQSQSRSQSRLSQPTTIALSPQPRSETPNAMRVRSRMNTLTAPSPTPPSYDRARAYLPPALPSGYRLSDGPLDPRSVSPSAGNTNRLIRTVQEQAQRVATPNQHGAQLGAPRQSPSQHGAPQPVQLGAPRQSPSQQHGPNAIHMGVSRSGHMAQPQAPRPATRTRPASSHAAQEPKKNDELDELGRKSDQLAERSRQMRAGYKLQGREIIKEKPEPLPQSLKDQLRDLQASRTSLHTEATNKDGYVTDVSSATWQFSGQSFSPRSVISVNGAKEEGLLKVRTSVDHLRQQQESGAIRREFNEAYARKVERYNSLPQLIQPSAVIHVKDDKPRSIMKRRELENREQMLYPAHQQEKSYTRTVSNVHKPVKTETVQRFEETRRTEEIERRVQRKERKDRRSRHHSSSRREEWGHGGGGGGEYDSDDELRVRREIEIREKREREIREHELRERERRMREIKEREIREHDIRERELRERELREREIRERELRERELREREIREREFREREARERIRHEQDAAVQVDLVEVKRPRVIYTRRAMTAAELAKYISDAHRVANQANRNMSQWRSSSLSRHQNGYLPSNESYFKQTSTRRDRDQSANRGAWEEERNLANARYGSLSDSLRRGELKYIPNGEVREAYYKDGRGGQKVHKSYSTRDVFDSGMDRHSAASYGAGGRRSSQGQGVQPLVEFPPTLPRRGQHEMDFRPVSKSRSFADWDDQSRAGFKGGHQDWAMQRRYDDDMTRLEAEFRDSLLMPIPNGNMHERDQRTEQLPGGYETYYKDNRANAGRRLNRDGQPVDFSDASHEYSYKREQETSDRRR